MNAIRVSGTSRLGRQWDQWRSTSFRNETASPKLLLETYLFCPDGWSDDCLALWAKEHMSAWNLGIHPTKRWAALCWLGCTKTCCTLGCRRSHCTGHIVHMLAKSGVVGTLACSRTKRTPADRQASANKSAANSKALAVSTCRSSAVVRPSTHHSAPAWRTTLEPAELPMSVEILALLAVHVSPGGVSKTPKGPQRHVLSNLLKLLVIQHVVMIRRLQIYQQHPDLKASRKTLLHCMFQEKAFLSAPRIKMGQHHCMRTNCFGQRLSEKLRLQICCMLQLHLPDYVVRSQGRTKTNRCRHRQAMTRDSHLKKQTPIQSASDGQPSGWGRGQRKTRRNRRKSKPFWNTSFEVQTALEARQSGKQIQLRTHKGDHTTQS